MPLKDQPEQKQATVNTDKKTKEALKKIQLGEETEVENESYNQDLKDLERFVKEHREPRVISKAAHSIANGIKKILSSNPFKSDLDKKYKKVITELENFKEEADYTKSVKKLSNALENANADINSDVNNDKYTNKETSIVRKISNFISSCINSLSNALKRINGKIINEELKFSAKVNQSLKNVNKKISNFVHGTKHRDRLRSTRQSETNRPKER